MGAAGSWGAGSLRSCPGRPTGAAWGRGWPGASAQLAADLGSRARSAASASSPRPGRRASWGRWVRAWVRPRVLRRCSRPGPRGRRRPTTRRPRGRGYAGGYTPGAQSPHDNAASAPEIRGRGAAGRPATARRARSEAFQRAPHEKEAHGDVRGDVRGAVRRQPASHEQPAAHRRQLPRTGSRRADVPTCRRQDNGSARGLALRVDRGLARGLALGGSPSHVAGQGWGQAIPPLLGVFVTSAGGCDEPDRRPDPATRRRSTGAPRRWPPPTAAGSESRTVDVKGTRTVDAQSRSPCSRSTSAPPRRLAKYATATGGPLGCRVCRSKGPGSPLALSAFRRFRRRDGAWSVCC